MATIPSLQRILLSTATGIPRETVRWKIDSLVAKGWLRRNHKGEVFMAESMVRHFHSDFDQGILRELLAVAERARSLIESKPKTAGESF